MYLCICRGVTERMVEGAIDDGCRSFKAVVNHTGLSTECGQCALRAKAHCDSILESLDLEAPLFKDAATV